MFLCGQYQTTGIGGMAGEEDAAHPSGDLATRSEYWKAGKRDGQHDPSIEIGQRRCDG